jgi:hypothetical protein
MLSQSLPSILIGGGLIVLVFGLLLRSLVAPQRYAPTRRRYRPCKECGV